MDKKKESIENLDDNVLDEIEEDLKRKEARDVSLITYSVIITASILIAYIAYIAY